VDGARGATPRAARYEEEDEERGSEGPTLVAPGRFGKEGNYAIVRLGRSKGGEGEEQGEGLWGVRDVSFEHLR
jgi:hypothetical protein